jgi:methionyl aminopeptidase
MVPGYHWTTCVNINEGVVHGIPKKEIVFERGDVVSVDIGVFYKGFHTDTSITVGIQVSKENQKFLDTGEEALRQAIKATRKGNRIFNISQAIEKTLTRDGYSPIRALVGHGVGRELHEEPQIPCFADERYEVASAEIIEGMVLAIEVMYSQGSGDVKLENDGWTISSSDDTITALFEDTVAITKEGSKVLT